MFVITLVLLSCAVLVLFSQEFAAGLKKLFAISWIKLVLPLSLATIPIVYYEAWVYWFLCKIKEILGNLTRVLAGHLPLQNAHLLAKVFFLFCLPLFYLMLREIGLKKNPTGNYQIYFIGTAILWFFILLLLVVDQYHII